MSLLSTSPSQSLVPTILSSVQSVSVSPSVDNDSRPTGEPTTEEGRIEGGLENEGNTDRDQPVTNTRLSGGVIATLVGIGVGITGILALAYGQKRRRERMGIPLY